MNGSSLLALVLLFAIIQGPGGAQQLAVPRNFDVASVKPSTSGGESRRAGASPGGRFTASNVSLKLLISRAYGSPEAQIQGGPRWVETDTWDIAARADTPLEMTREQLRPCLQALLAERFKLTIRRETKQGTVFSLMVAKGGSKLKEHTGAGASAISAPSGAGKISITGANTTIGRLAEYLAGQAGRPVLDNTGLKGQYDFRLEWSTGDVDASTPSIFAALAEQLGLRIDATKGPVEIIIVDPAEKASAD